MSVDEPAAGNAEPQVEVDAEPHAEVLQSEKPARTGQVRRKSPPPVLLPMVAAMVLLLGSGIAAGAYYVTSVPTPELAPLPSATTLQYNDGSVLAQIGSVDRVVLGQQELVDVVKQAAVAAEDKDFWTSGTGAITRSVVRSATNTVATTTAAKARVAVQAWKLDGVYSKDEILAYYLNAIPFGRQTYGVEAAAHEYFGGKTARRDAPPERQLTTAEAMFLLALVRQPYPDPDNAAGSPGFDPAAGELARQNSRLRWAEIRDEMVALNYLTAEAAAGLVYPDALSPPSGPQSALSAPAGLIVNHVMDELSHTTGSPYKGKTWDSIANGGLTVITTIDPRAQQVLERTADETVAGSALNGQPDNLQAAGVVVEPGTGRVLAYFGGHEGGGNDYAGFYYDEAGEATGVGRYPPGGTFMLYTLAAALKAGFSLHSHWRWTPHEQPGRPASNPIRNASTCTSDVASTGACSLLESVAYSINVPMYDVTVSVSPAKVLEMARDAGIDTMWTDDRARQDLRATVDMTTLTPVKFDMVLGLGQYPVTVLDQANAMATFAAGGLRASAHFVKEVRIRDEVVFGEVLPNLNEPRILSADQIADLTYALTWAGTGPTSGLAIKTGVWELTNRPSQLGHTWSLGYTTKLAIAVHIGNRSDEQPLLERTGAPIFGSGLPSTIMRTVMTGVHEQLGLEPTPFPAPVFAGNENPPGSVPG